MAADWLILQPGSRIVKMVAGSKRIKGARKKGLSCKLRHKEYGKYGNSFQG